MTTQTAKKKTTTAQNGTLNACPTKSAKIRFLDSEGWSRGDISRFLEIRYQHVRNVLITPVKNPVQS